MVDVDAIRVLVRSHGYHRIKPERYSRWCELILLPNFRQDGA